jgi:hypothetical protein
MRVFLISLFFGLSLFGNAQTPAEKVAYSHIVDLKSSVILVRLQTQDIVLDKMKRMRQNNLLRAKIQEINSHHLAVYRAFSSAFSFTEVYFFYGRNTEQIKNREWEGLFVDSSLKYNSSITLPKDTSFYVIDVGDIYFDAFGGHFEGMVVLDENFVPLKKPFPYYVRRRSGMTIIKRTDLEMATIFQKEFENFYQEAKRRYVETKKSP